MGALIPRVAAVYRSFQAFPMAMHVFIGGERGFFLEHKIGSMLSPLSCDLLFSFSKVIVSKMMH